MNRRDLVKAIAAQTEVDAKTVDAVVKGFTDVVTAVVAKGEPVAITGFAKFAKVERAARMGRNPATGEAIKIKASKKARITPLKGFKDAVVKTSLAPKLERGVWPPAPPAKKTASKKTTAAKKTTAKKSTGTARKSTAKKASARKTTAKKATTKRPPAKRPATKKAAAKKTTAKKATARR